MKRYHDIGCKDFRESPSGRWVKFVDVERLQAAIATYRNFVHTLECTNANCGLGSMMCSVCRIKEKPPENEA